MANDRAEGDSRGLVAGLTLGYLVFFVYGSLVPLHYTPHPFAQAWADFLAAPGAAWRDEERVDVAVNFLLTVPLAFGLAQLATTWRAAWARVSAWLLIWPAVALLSVGVEFVQSFFPPRDPSWTDVAAQWGGAVAGMALYGLAGRRFRALLAGLAQRSPAPSRARLWLGVYLALMLAFSVMPLDLSISPVELYRKWRDGRVVLLPFGSPWPGLWQFLYDFATDILLWVPVGLLWRIDGQGRSVRAVVLRTVLAAACVEGAQLLVLSRVTDVTDVLMAAVGGALGAGLPHRLRGWRAMDTQRRDRWLARGWWLWLTIAVAVLWLPFDVSTAGASLDAAAQAFTRMPFQTYFETGEFHALNEILRKLLVFLPGGLLLGARRSQRGPGLGTMWLLAFALEVGQLFLPSKVADLTDAVLGCAGAWLGWRIARSFDGLAGPSAAAKTPPPAPKPAAPAPAVPETAAPPPLKPPPRGLQAGLVAALALLFWLAGHTPGLPYNLAKLFPPGFGGVLSAAGLAFTVWWLLAAPLWLLQPQRRLWRLLFPLPVLGHALVSFAVVRATLPLVMLYKVIGNPTLGWDGPWEDIGRFVALHACVLLPLLGAALLVRTVQRPRTGTDLLYWVLVMLVLFWPLHWVVVERAGTDNLVELMRGGGSLGASLALGSAWLLVAAAGGALAAALAPRRRRPLLVLAVVALALAPLLFAAGLEPMLVKYERTFSALQFIVSAARDRYATGAELALRAAFALAAMVSSVAVLQAAPWRALAAADPVKPARRRGQSRRPAAA